uniref:Uncharacterized protein n=1 Tax=Setaria digitata TaxID=48799 RepID=A0A915PPT5_9BILA
MKAKSKGEQKELYVDIKPTIRCLGNRPIFPHSINQSLSSLAIAFNAKPKCLESGYDPGASAEACSKSSGEQLSKSVTMKTILSQPVYDVFVQHDKSFRRTDRKRYERMLEARMNDLLSITPSENVQSALMVQTAFHNISLIIQGFLSGFSTMHAIFAFAFASMDIIHENYTWLAMPIQAVFYVCFVISTTAAFDRFETSSSLMNSLKRGLSLQSGALGILLCLTGTIATLVLTSNDDEWFAAPIKQRKMQNVIDINPLFAWHLFSGVRALAGLLSWLLLALSPSNNVLLNQIRNPVR